MKYPVAKIPPSLEEAMAFTPSNRDRDLSRLTFSQAEVHDVRMTTVVQHDIAGF